MWPLSGLVVAALLGPAAAGAADIADLDDPDLLQPPLDRSFKKPAGYVMRDKLAVARERSGVAKRTASDR